MLISLLFTVFAVLEHTSILNGNVVIKGLLFICLYLTILTGVNLLERLIVRFYPILTENSQSLDLILYRFTNKKEGLLELYGVMFLIMAGVRVVIQLNQWPGSYCVDAPGQMEQVLGDAPFNNINPLISTLAVKICVDIATGFGGDVNSGVALYSVVQLIWMSMISSFVVILLIRMRVPAWCTIISFLFYAFSPLNICYQTGMWKDVFFAGWVLLFTAHIYYLVREDSSKKWQWALVTFESVMVCIARNSGWSALLMWIPVLFFAQRKQQNGVLKKAVITVSTGLIISIAVQTIGYQQIFHVGKSPSETSLSVPLQQLARIIATDKELTTEEIGLLNKVCDPDMVKAIYDDYTADYAKGSFDTDYMADHAVEYIGLWMRLGIKNPATYLLAYYRQMHQYFWPGSRVWLIDNRIFDNPYDIHRTPLLFPGSDLVMMYFGNAFLSHLISDQGRLFWMLLFSTAFARRHGSPRDRLFYYPSLFIYLGLFLTAPLSLFRYVYSVYLMLPLFVIWLMDTTAFNKKRKRIN